jgi:hypothetical protein
MTMTKVTSRQTVYEVHEYDLDTNQMKQFRKIKGQENKQNFLDNIGGSCAEYEPIQQFKFEVTKDE